MSIATYDQARRAIAAMPREKIDELVLDVIEALYGETPCDGDEDDEKSEHLADTMSGMVLNSELEWTPANIEQVALHLDRFKLNPTPLSKL
jgi:hypothetical protein